MQILTQKEFNELYESHSRWLKRDYDNPGNQMNLFDCLLDGIEFPETIRGAVFEKCRIIPKGSRRIRFECCEFTKSELICEDVKLFSNCKFDECDLQNTNRIERIYYCDFNTTRLDSMKYTSFHCCKFYEVCFFPNSELYDVGFNQCSFVIFDISFVKMTINTAVELWTKDGILTQDVSDIGLIEM